MNRRKFLTALATSGVALSVADLGAASGVSQSGNRTLWLHRSRQNESIRETYRMDGALVSDAYMRLCYGLRDTEDAMMALMDPALLDLLYVLQRYATQLVGQMVPIEVLDGFRTDAHNARLVNMSAAVRQKRGIERAADNSQHPKGTAADIRIPGMTPGAVAQLALSLGFGGVGQYDRFTHVDVGPHRTWASSPAAAVRQ